MTPPIDSVSPRPELRFLLDQTFSERGVLYVLQIRRKAFFWRVWLDLAGTRDRTRAAVWARLLEIELPEVPR